MSKKPVSELPVQKSSCGPVVVIVIIAAGVLLTILFWATRPTPSGPGQEDVVLVVDSVGPFINVSYIAGDEAQSADQSLEFENDKYLWQRPVDVDPGDFVSLTASGPAGEGITCQILVDGRVWLQAGGIGVCTVTGTLE